MCRDDLFRGFGDAAFQVDVIRGAVGGEVTAYFIRRLQLDRRGHVDLADAVADAGFEILFARAAAAVQNKRNAVAGVDSRSRPMLRRGVAV